MEKFLLNDGNGIPAIGFGVFLIPNDGSTYTAVRAALDAESAVENPSDAFWGAIHEFNHHFQRFGFAPGDEVTNNAVSLVEYSLFTRISANRALGSALAVATPLGFVGVCLANPLAWGLALCYCIGMTTHFLRRRESAAQTS